MALPINKFGASVSQVVGQVNTSTGGDYVISANGASIQIRNNNKGSAADVTLPAEAAATGLVFYFKESGSANDLTIKNDGGGTVATCAAGKAVWVACDGTNWINMYTQA